MYDLKQLTTQQLGTLLLATEAETATVAAVRRDGYRRAGEIADELKLGPSNRTRLALQGQALARTATHQGEEAMRGHAINLLEIVAHAAGTTVPDLRKALAARMREVLTSRPVESLFPVNGRAKLDVPDAGSLMAAFGTMEKMVGIEAAKLGAARLAEEVVFDRARRVSGHGVVERGQNVVLEGGRGLGKTQYAGLLGKMREALGLCMEGGLFELKRSDFGSLLKHFETAKTEGKTVYIPDVSMLLEKSHPSENHALRLADIMKQFEGEVAVIIGGRRRALSQVCKKAPMLERLLGHRIHLHDLTTDELEQVFLRLCEASGFKAGPEVREKVRAVFDRTVRGEDFGNAALVTDCMARWTGNAAARFTATNDESALSTLEPSDIDVPQGVMVVGDDTSGFATVADVNEALDRYVVGQKEAKDALSTAVILRLHSKRDTQATRKPVGSHLFVGPSGVGKSHLAYALSMVCYGGRRYRIPGSELTERHDCVALLRGASAGYLGHDKGSPMPDKIREFGGSCLIQIDEVDKADPVLWDIFMEVMDTGQFMDNEGNPVDCRNVHFLLTGNYGNESRIYDLVGDGDYADPAKVEVDAEAAVGQSIRPEQLNRLSDGRAIVLKPLSQAAQHEIFNRELQGIVGEQLAGRGLRIRATPAVRGVIVADATSATMGNRPLERALQRRILLPIYEALSRDSKVFGRDATIEVYLDGSELQFRGITEEAPDVEEGTDEVTLRLLTHQSGLARALGPLARQVAEEPGEQVGHEGERVKEHLSGIAAAWQRTGDVSDAVPRVLRTLLERADRPVRVLFLAQVVQGLTADQPQTASECARLILQKASKQIESCAHNVNGKHVLPWFAGDAIAACMDGASIDDQITTVKTVCEYPDAVTSDVARLFLAIVEQDDGARCAKLLGMVEDHHALAAQVAGLAAWDSSLSETQIAFAARAAEAVPKGEWDERILAFKGDSVEGREPAVTFAQLEILIRGKNAAEESAQVRELLARTQKRTVTFGPVSADDLEVVLVDASKGKGGKDVQLRPRKDFPDGLRSWVEVLAGDKPIGAYRFVTGPMKSNETQWKWSGVGFDNVPPDVKVRLRAIAPGFNRPGTRLPGTDPATGVRSEFDYRQADGGKS